MRCFHLVSMVSGLSCFFFLTGLQADQNQKKQKKAPFFLSMSTTTETYERLMWQMGLEVNPTDVLSEVVAAGKRMYQWIDHINTIRDPDAAISISDPTSIAVYPIDEYKFSNREIVRANFDAFFDVAPEWFAKVVFDGTPFTDKVPVSLSEFAQIGREMDTIYRAASRWLLQEPYLISYIQRKDEDVRGYYHLTRVNDLQEELASWSSLTDERKKQMRSWLVGLCTNSSTLFGTSCARQFDRALDSGGLWEFYSQKLPGGKKTWDSFYGIRGVRSDIVWGSSDPQTMTIPFKNPQDTEVESFLVDNLVDEYQWDGWAMKLDFVSDGSVPYIRFIDGATPNVNGLGGNRITMDSSVPLTDYAVNWTIRHEFGHVLGWKDCYVEFYDSEVFYRPQLRLVFARLLLWPWHQ